MVLMTTAPHPSSRALPTTFALVPGGPEPITKGLGSLRPSTVVARVAMKNSGLCGAPLRNCSVLPEAGAALHEGEVEAEAEGERHEPGVGVDGDEGSSDGGLRVEQLPAGGGVDNAGDAGGDRQHQRGDASPVHA